jgi:hypothetical protein
MIRIIAVLACCAFGAGCVSISKYPAEWAEKARVKSGSCPVIDGEYQNVGESLEKTRDGIKRTNTSLAAALSAGFSMESDALGLSEADPLAVVPAEDAVGTETEKVHLELVGDILQVTTTRLDGTTTRFDRPVESKCRDSMLLVETDWSTTLNDEDSPTGIWLHLLERESWKLGRAEDGSLLMHVSYVSSLMVLEWPIFPVVASGWIRFPAVEPASPSAERVADALP